MPLQCNLKDLEECQASHLAVMLNCSTNTIKTLVRTKGMPHRKVRHNVYFDTAQAIAWYFEYKYGAEGEAVGKDANIRYRAAKAERAELDLLEKSGELVLREEARRVFLDVAAVAGPHLDSIAGRLANELAGETDPGAVRQRIFEETRRVRTQVAGELLELAQKLGNGGKQAVERAVAEDA